MEVGEEEEEEEEEEICTRQINKSFEQKLNLSGS